MSKTYRSGNTIQRGLATLSVQDRLPENDPVYFILEAVNELDISDITAKYEQQDRGFPPYAPRMMVALLLYSYCRGLFSSHKIMQACQEWPFRAIVGDHIPDWRTISNFRKLHVKELEGLFVQILKLCQRAGFSVIGDQGSGNSKNLTPGNRTLTNGRMKYAVCLTAEEEQRLRHEIHRLLSSAEAVDQQEDQRSRTRDERRETRDEDVEQLTRQQNCLDRTWDEAARKCIEVYREVISKYKNCPRR